MHKEIIQASRILIIDDQAENVLLLERALHSAGYINLASITDSRETFRTLTQFQPDLVAMDLRMPHLDGFALLRELRSRVLFGTYLPVLVLTSDNSRKARQEALALGAKDFLTKPIDVAEALLRIYNLLETRWLYVELQRQSETLEEKVRVRTEELRQAQLEIVRRAANEELSRLYERIAQLLVTADGEPAVPIDREEGRDVHQNLITPEEMLARVGRLIGDHKRLEEQLRHAQKMEAVGRLAGGIAHDFNNLLTVILGYATAVDQQLETTHRLRPMMAQIKKAGEQAALLTGQLLAFSRKQVRQPRVLDLSELVQDMKEMLRSIIGEDIVLDVVSDTLHCLVEADAGQLTQVLLNLAANARDALPTGGKLTIETRTVQRAREEVGSHGTRLAGRYTLLAVTDNGTGMDAEIQKHIFEPFFTSKDPGKGTGLGLSIVYGIVEQHGGWIDVYSEPSHGASFRIYLPEAATGVATTVETRSVSTTKRIGTILLVEDQAIVRMLEEDTLAADGHQVLSAGSGLAALKLAEAYHAKIDLLITDVVMPEMSGPDVAARLTQVRPGLIVLYTSGYSDHALLRGGVFEAGTAFLQKPFLPQALIDKVQELLGVEPSPAATAAIEARTMR
jgi:signal transduction histidine kinase